MSFTGKDQGVFFLKLFGKSCHCDLSLRDGHTNPFKGCKHLKGLFV